MNEQARAMLIVGALLSGASFSAGGVAGRMTAPVPVPTPPEIRYIPIPAPAATLVAPAPAPVLEEKPEPAPVAPVEAKPLPPVKPKADVKPKPKPEPPPVRKPRAVRPSLPSCDVIKRAYNRMSYVEQMAEYRRATAEQIAHGRRCLGM